MQNNLGYNQPDKEIKILQRNSANIKSQENMMIMRGKAKSDQIKKTRYQDLLAQHYHKNKPNSQIGNLSRNKPNFTQEFLISAQYFFLSVRQAQIESPNINIFVTQNKIYFHSSKHHKWHTANPCPQC